VLPSGAENVQTVAAGQEATAEAAIGSASDALVVVASDRGMEEYRVTVAGVEMIFFPGLTDEGDVDLIGLRDAVLSIARRL